MKISKIAKLWLQDQVKNLEALRAELPMKEKEASAYFALWKVEHNHTVWDKWANINSEINCIKSNIQYLEMITGVLEGKPLYANEVMYSDIRPYEVIEMKTDKTWVIRAMTATIKKEAQEALRNSFVPGGFCGHLDNSKQEWDIISDENGVILTIRFHNSKTSRGWFNGRQYFSVNTHPIMFYDYNF